MFEIQKILIQERYFTLEYPFTTAHSTHTIKRILFAEMHTTCGKVCQSECAAGDWPGYSEETVETAKVVIEEDLIPALVGREIEHPSDVHYLLMEHAPDSPLARATLEMGAWVLAAQCEGFSLDEYLGGRTRMVPVGKSFGLMPIDELVAQIREAGHNGYQRVKIKVTPDTVLMTLEALAKKVKRSIPIMIDANGTFTDRDLDLLRDVDRYRLMMIEQPFRKSDWKLTAEAQRLLKTPICLDESIRSVEDVDKMVKMKAGKIVTLKPACLGGFTVAMDIVEYCQRYQIPMWVGGMLESSVGKTYLSAFATLEGMTYPGDLVTTLKP